MDVGPEQTRLLLARRQLPLLMLFLTILLASLYIVTTTEVERIRNGFIREAKGLFRSVDIKAKTYEISLEGFAQHLQAQPRIDYRKARHFAANLRTNYPEIYMLELAEYVPGAGKRAFEQQMQRAGYPDFTIQRFDYAGDRQSQAAASADAYYPLTFIEPQLPAARPLLGLDLLSSSRELREGLERALREQRQTASELFHFAEGDLGYLLYRPFLTEQQRVQHPAQPHIAIAAVRVTDLIAPELLNAPNWRLTIFHPRASGGTELDQLTLSAPSPAPAPGLLPAFTLHHRLSSGSQPLTMEVSFSPSWQQLDHRFLATVALVLLMLSWLFVRLLRRSSAQLQAELGFMQGVIEQAHYDTLTRLPNVNLLMDRIEQSLTQSQRNRALVALIYLDFDRFKQINDTHGHACGDELLIQASERMVNALRAVDTVSRIHGDEFVVLLPQVDGAAGARQAIDKLKGAFAAPFALKSGPITVSLSAGFALYPDDGEDAEELLALADQRMYRDKSAARN